MTHLVLALSTKGYGETTLGLRIAAELHARGHRCVFLAHASAARLFAGTPFQHTTVADHTLGLLKAMLLALIRKIRPASILLSDYFTAALAAERARLDADFFSTCGVPVGAIDTWDLRRSGTAVDVFGSEQRRFADWSDRLRYRLVPVPFARPVAGADAVYYSCLPAPVATTAKVRRHIRRDLGVADHERVILFCTAGWQHATFASEHANRVARLVPLLIGQYVRCLGPRVHLVHVGPSRFPIDLEGRYHWLPALPPDDFDALLASVDLLLAANASSTTIGTALVSGVPSAVLVNSHSVGSADEIQRHGDPARVALVTWLCEASPVYPFYMWPIGYHRFLQPLLVENRYCAAVPLLELLEPECTVATVAALLFDEARRRDSLERQAEYVREVRQLPSGGSLVSSLLA